MSQNLLGLLDLKGRFEGLHTAFLFQLQYADAINPLHRLLFRWTSGRPLHTKLRESRPLNAWKRRASKGDLTKASLHQFIRRRLAAALAQESHRNHPTALIPWDSRMRSGLLYADRTLAAPARMQDTFFRYRRGVWCFRFKHNCPAATRPFQRGDEDCVCQGQATRLSQRDLRRKAAQGEGLGKGGKFTNVDFLLNNKQWARPYDMMLRVHGKLKTFLEEQVEEADSVGEVVHP